MISLSRQWVVNDREKVQEVSLKWGKQKLCKQPRLRHHMPHHKKLASSRKPFDGAVKNNLKSKVESAMAASVSVPETFCFCYRWRYSFCLGWRTWRGSMDSQFLKYLEYVDDICLLSHQIMKAGEMVLHLEKEASKSAQGSQSDWSLSRFLHLEYRRRQTDIYVYKARNFTITWERANGRIYNAIIAVMEGV